MNRLYKRLVCIILLMIIAVSTIKAQQEDRVLHFLSLPSSAQGMSVGGVTASIIANEPLLALDNPALFGVEHNNQLSMAYMNYLSNTHYGTAFYSKSWGDRRSWGIGARFLSNGVIHGRDIYGNNTSSYTANDIVLQGSISYDLSDYIRGGVSLKGIYSNISEFKAMGIGVDLGLNYYNESRDTSIGICLLNAGAIIKPYDNKREAMPWDIRIGMSHKLAKAPIVVNVTLYDINRSRDYIKVNRTFVQKAIRHLAFGVQFVPNKQFYIAVGYNPKIAQDMDYRYSSKLSGITAGVGFMTSRYRIAVSSMSLDKSNYALMATFSWDFRNIYTEL